jgi:hypothetical protein
MSARQLRHRIDRLEAAFHKQSRMAELVAKFKTGDLTPEEDKEALSLDRRWPATKASIMADWELQFRRKRDAGTSIGRSRVRPSKSVLRKGSGDV